MATATELRDKVSELRDDLIAVVTRYIVANSDMPAQAVMAGLGK